MIFYGPVLLWFSDGEWDSEICTSSNVARDTVCTLECREGFYRFETSVFTCIQDSVTFESVWDFQDKAMCVPGCLAIPAFSRKDFTI